MSIPDKNYSHLRHLPQVHALLESEHAQVLMAKMPRQIVLDEVRAELDTLRQRVLAGEAVPPFSEANIFAAITRRLQANDLRRLQRVVNATGIVIHTNLGRAPMAEEAVEAVTNAARHYSNLEMDLATGKRGGRGGQIEELLQKITGAEAALVVNNNAAAVLLALSTVAAGSDVVISRGELVEIGGGFRIPEVITQSGARLVEVGTTNKTRAGDYAKAVTPETKVLLKVHASNYRIVGFTAEATLPELVGLGAAHNLLVMNDLGSGALVDVTQFGLPHEPTVQETMNAGADIATVSGDKLLGGPQCGIILGKSAVIGRMGENPLYRALRADKLILAALEATLRLYLDEERLTETVPVLHMLSRSKAELTKRARRLRNALARLPEIDVRLVDGVGYTGGGALPTVPLLSKIVQVKPHHGSVEQLAEALRHNQPPVIGMLADGYLNLDVRTVRDSEFSIIVQAIERAGEAAIG